MSQLLRVHHFEPISVANGPGRRSVLWLQGCTLGCSGCFNQETHSSDAGITMTVEEIFQQIEASIDSVQGLTVSGGEPLQQPEPLLSLLKQVREQTDLSILLLTGFSDAELLRHPQWTAFTKIIDVAITGRYEQSRRLALGLVGSQNKSVRFFTKRYCRDDLDQVPPAEIVVGTDGVILMSGIDPMEWDL